MWDRCAPDSRGPGATTLLRVSRSWHAAMYRRSAHYVSFVRARERHLCTPGIINPFSDGWADYRSFPNVRIFVCIRIMREDAVGRASSIPPTSFQRGYRTSHLIKAILLYCTSTWLISTNWIRLLLRGRKEGRDVSKDQFLRLGGKLLLSMDIVKVY